ncbi:basic proline-rich protein-like [Zalophus californianus]|uniref:Basic proline-rich protein-like n=1 Tax=Zalophus californianus TaxID=9704 RepID=A0A6J2EFL7_ZALCA|nr:basic proline-rich protein-like [Zalophus californianus]
MEVSSPSHPAVPRGLGSQSLRRPSPAGQTDHLWLANPSCLLGAAVGPDLSFRSRLPLPEPPGWAQGRPIPHPKCPVSGCGQTPASPGEAWLLVPDTSDRHQGHLVPPRGHPSSKQGEVPAAPESFHPASPPLSRLPYPLGHLSAPRHLRAPLYPATVWGGSGLPGGIKAQPPPPLPPPVLPERSAAFTFSPLPPSAPAAASLPKSPAPGAGVPAAARGSPLPQPPGQRGAGEGEGGNGATGTPSPAAPAASPRRHADGPSRRPGLSPGPHTHPRAPSGLPGPPSPARLWLRPGAGLGEAGARPPSAPPPPAQAGQGRGRLPRRRVVRGAVLGPGRASAAAESPSSPPPPAPSAPRAPRRPARRGRRLAGDSRALPPRRAAASARSRPSRARRPSARPSSRLRAQPARPLRRRSPNLRAPLRSPPPRRHATPPPTPPLWSRCQFNS